MFYIYLFYLSPQHYWPQHFITQYNPYIHTQYIFSFPLNFLSPPHPLAVTFHPHWATFHAYWTTFHPHWATFLPHWASLHPHWATFHPHWATFHPHRVTFLFFSFVPFPALFLLIQYSSLVMGWYACCCAGMSCCCAGKNLLRYFSAPGFSWTEQGRSAGRDSNPGLPYSSPTR